MTKEFHFTWQWDLKSSPEALWSFAADTNRFNRDTGQPRVRILSNIKGVKQMRMLLPILQVEWEEIDLGEAAHPNSARVELQGESTSVGIVAASIGGGTICVEQIGEYDVDMRGQLASIVAWLA